mmetsp:Transcript_269/g.734  ORF Transcript_269/g.734 Transcript_269/m.734 type:complete len:513 (+) Transcript_269:140-1678(+)
MTSPVRMVLAVALVLLLLVMFIQLFNTSKFLSQYQSSSSWVKELEASHKEGMDSLRVEMEIAASQALEEKTRHLLQSHATEIANAKAESEQQLQAEIQRITNELHEKQSAEVEKIKSDMMTMANSSQSEQLETSRNTREPKKIPKKIAYAFNGYLGDMFSIPTALAAVFDVDNVYGVMLDASVNKSSMEILKQLIVEYVLESPNGCLTVTCVEQRVFVTKGEFSVTYGGISESLPVLDIMHMLLEFNSEWDFFINLTPFDYPLGSQEDIQKLLTKMKGQSFCGVSGGHPPSLARGLFQQRWMMNNFDPSLLKVRNPNDVERLKTIPVGLGFPDNVTDDGNGTSSVFHVYQAEAYGIFERKFCVYALTSAVTRRVIALLSRGFGSTEQLLPTIIMNQKKFKNCGFTMRGNNIASGPIWPMPSCKPSFERNRTHCNDNVESFLQNAKNSSLLFYRKFPKVPFDPVNDDATVIAAAYKSEMYRTAVRKHLLNKESEYSNIWRQTVEHKSAIRCKV